MQALCEFLYKEIDAITERTDDAYGELERALTEVFDRKTPFTDRFSHKVRSLKKVKPAFKVERAIQVRAMASKIREKARRAREAIEACSVGDSLGENASALTKMNLSYRILESGLPSISESDELAEEILAKYDNTKHGISQEALRQFSPLLGIATLLVTPEVHSCLGPLAETVSFVSGALALSTPLFKRPYFNIISSTFGMTALSLYGLFADTPIFGGGLESKLGLGLVAGTTLLAATDTARFVLKRAYFRAITKRIKGAKMQL